MYKREDLHLLLKRLKADVEKYFEDAPAPHAFLALQNSCFKNFVEMDLDASHLHTRTLAFRAKITSAVDAAVQRILVTCDPTEKLLVAEKMAVVKSLIQPSIPQTSLKGIKAVIIGAGVTGLTLAYLLAVRGAQISLYEKRGRLDCQGIEPTVVERGQNVSWTGLEKVLAPLISEETFRKLQRDLFSNGAVIDPGTGKIRSSIGAYQEVLIHGLQKFNITPQYGVKFSRQQLQQYSDADFICVASGIKSLQAFPDPSLTKEDFSGTICKLYTALAMYPCEDKPIGFYRCVWSEGQESKQKQRLDWRIKNENVQSQAAFATEIARYIANLEKFRDKLNIPKERIQDLEKCLAKASRVAHVFYFGKNSPLFLSDVPEDSIEYPLLEIPVDVPLWMLTRCITKNAAGTPLIYAGDASGSTNPLAANGNHLCLKNAKEILRYATGLSQLQTIQKSSLCGVLEDLLLQIKGFLLEYCNCHLTQDRTAIFLQTYLCYLYSYSLVPAAVK